MDEPILVLNLKKADQHPVVEESDIDNSRISPASPKQTVDYLEQIIASPRKDFEDDEQDFLSQLTFLRDVPHQDFPKEAKANLNFVVLPGAK